LDTPRRADVHRAPVDLLHATANTRNVEPVPELERLLEQQKQAREYPTHRVLQRETDDDRSDTQRREQAADIRAPHPTEQDRDRHNDDEKPHDIDKDRRQPLPPRALASRHEEGEIEAIDEHENDEKSEDGRDDARPVR